MADPPQPNPTHAASGDWLPPLVLMADFGNSWQPFIDSVYAVFCADFVTSQPRLNGLWVRHRRDPIYDGKEAGFWHCVSEGKTEDERLPDLRRCERIRWLRALIEHSTDERVDIWENERSGDRRVLIWFNEEYLVVLGYRERQRDGFHYYMLLTAYTTPETSRREKLRKERKAYQAGP